MRSAQDAAVSVAVFQHCDREKHQTNYERRKAHKKCVLCSGVSGPLSEDQSTSDGGVGGESYPKLGFLLLKHKVCRGRLSQLVMFLRG